ncbi:MAG TPA: hypothetical protein VEN82_08045 [Actinomycetota bacterium]|nr:hypothetical protein [Actinomycetota bacterium]
MRCEGTGGGANRGRAAAACALAALVLSALLAGCHASGTRPVDAGGSPCPSSDPLRGVYHPWRLHVLETCATYSGTVRGTRDEQDGDHHLYVVPDSGDERFLDAKSRSYGDLIVEIMPGQTLPVPAAGAHVTFVGTWAFDTEHGWNEIHPVWAETIDGRLFVSLPPVTPQYQGSGGP